jgi:alkylation response protein AidB-like acyl-CoA dehydrogenase
MDFQLNDEQRMWQKAVHDFCATEVKPVAAEMDRTESFNHEAFKKMGALGILGMNIAEEYVLTQSALHSRSWN